ncbi:MAG: hypothetical protein HY698_14290 [Deltaproteobacteria bacterium]|nr:hypothetical protein [Deltaproteobacteria bacterium]
MPDIRFVSCPVSDLKEKAKRYQPFIPAKPLLSFCAEASGTGNLYVGIQPRPERFLAQAQNRLARVRAGAHDQDIEQITTIVMDLDPVRPKDTASTEEELAHLMPDVPRRRRGTRHPLVLGTSPHRHGVRGPSSIG